MKKILIFLAVLTLLLTSCVSTRPLDKDKLPSKDDGTDLPVIENLPADIGDEKVELKSVSCRWYSAWANWTDDERVMQGIINPDTVSHDYPRTHLPLYRIDSVEALKKFILDYGEVFSMNATYDENVGFADATDHCNSEFFEEKVLLVTYMEAPSGSFRYGIGRISITDGKLLVEIVQKNNPEAHTDDMSGWLVTAEVKRESIDACASFDAVYSGIHVPEYVEGLPPILTVSTPYEWTEAVLSGFHWSGIIADSDYPYNDDFLDNINYLSNDEFTDDKGSVYGKLAFDSSGQPEVNIRRWKVEDGKHDPRNDEVLEVTEGGFFPLNHDGCYVYSVHASWEKVDNVGGSADYYFCVGSRDDKADLTEPPSLIVMLPDTEIKACMGTSSWFYPNGDGTSGAKMYDSNHPMSAPFVEVMPTLPNDKYVGAPNDIEVQLKFEFDRTPKITVRRWNIGCLSQSDVDSLAEEVYVIDGNRIPINVEKERYIYEVTAVWDKSDGLGGNVTYVFSIGPTK